MSGIKDHILSQLPDGAEMQLYAQAEQVAQAFHETYERLASERGYRTRRASAAPWAHVPRQNQTLMIAVCAELLERGVIAGPDPEQP